MVKRDITTIAIYKKTRSEMIKLMNKDETFADFIDKMLKAYKKISKSKKAR